VVVPRVTESVPSLALAMLLLNLAGFFLWHWLRRREGVCDEADLLDPPARGRENR
jgi:hypothetical protein